MQDTFAATATNQEPIEGSLNSVNETSSEKETEARNRLQQAAHILATGAIRAAQKQKAEGSKIPRKQSKKAAPNISGYRTSAEIGVDGKHEAAVKQQPNSPQISHPAPGVMPQVP